MILTLLLTLPPLYFFALHFVTATHELGHYIAARYALIHVEEFSIGTGPTLFSKKWHKTQFVWHLFPNCGYISVLSAPDATSRKLFFSSVDHLSCKLQALIASAGCISNALWGVILGIMAATTDWQIATPALQYCAFFSLFSCIFNLIPYCNSDGEKLLECTREARVRRRMHKRLRHIKRAYHARLRQSKVSGNLRPIFSTRRLLHVLCHDRYSR